MKLMATPRTPYNSPVANYSDVKGVKKLLKTPGAAPKSPRNVLDDFTGVADLVNTPVEAVPSTSKVGKTNKRKAEETPVNSASKKVKIDEASTSRSGSRISAKSSPSKTSRGGKASPKMDIPKFSLEGIEESVPDNKSLVKATRGRRGAKKVVEEAEVSSPAPKRRGRAAKVVEPETEQVPEDEKEISPVKPRRGRKAAAPAVTSTPVLSRSKKTKEVETVKTVDKSVTVEEPIEEVQKSRR